MYQNYFQSKQWRQIKESKRWQVDLLDSKNGQISCFRYDSPLGSIVYIPGLDIINSQNLAVIKDHYSKTKCLVCKVEPCIPADPQLQKVFATNGWKPARSIQYHHSVVLDLAKSEDQLLADVKKRGRYEIRQAQKAGVLAKEYSPTTENLNKMYDLLTSTSSRKKFTVREKSFVFDFWQVFAAAGKLKLFFAYKDSQLIAGAVVILSDDGLTAWYKEGGSIIEQANLFGSRQLLWQVILGLKKVGVKTFDLGGIPDPANYQKSSMRGIYIFKTAFSSESVAMMPAYEVRLRPISYKLWQSIETLYLRVFKRLRIKLTK